MPDDRKARLRKRLKALRQVHVDALPDQVRALVFHRPPALVADHVPAEAVVGLYFPSGSEAPTQGYARWFQAHGHVIALPRFGGRNAPMTFGQWLDPYDNGDLEDGPFGILQPSDDAAEAFPDILFVPGVAFTPGGERLGQGGGHYDRWLAAHPGVPAFGLAWDCQIVDRLPLERHDARLQGVITPTRFHQGQR